MIAEIAPLGWHVDLHFDAIDLPEYADMLARLPVRYTIDHMGRVKAADGLDQLPFKTLIELMQRDEKCWVKVCGCERVSSAGPPFTTRCRSRERSSRPRRIASCGAPIGRIPTSRRCQTMAISSISFRCLRESALQQKILVDNPARLFEF